MNATMSKPVRSTLLDMRQLQGQNLLGKEGLMSLLAAIRRMIGWLLSPFRTVAKVLFGHGAPTGAEPNADFVTGNAPVQLPERTDQLAFTATPEGVEPSDEALVDQMLATGTGTVDVELQGPPEEIDVLLPMLQKHVEQLLKSHLPADAEAAKVEGRVVALAETAEFVRYAHHIVSRQVDSMVRAIADNKLYDGMSPETILQCVRAAGESGAKANVDGSAEERLLARLALQDKIASDYAQQLRQIAAVLVRPAQGEGEQAGNVASEAPGALEAVVLRAADVARTKLLQRGTVVQSSLDELPMALKKAMESARAAQVQSVVEVDGVAGPEESGATAVVAVAPAAPVAAAVEAPPKVEAKAAPVAAKPAGMFGAAHVARSAEELDEVNLIDDSLPEMEGMVVG
jgi:hypothetical protein